MAAGEVHVGDIGTIFEVTFYDETGAVLNISTATEKKLTFKKTDGTSLVVDLVFVTDGVDGKGKYIAVDTDIDQEGGWQLQGRVVLASGGPWHSDIHDLEIHPTL